MKISGKLIVDIAGNLQAESYRGAVGNGVAVDIRD